MAVYKAMKDIEALIREVNGTMAIEGMPLSDDEKQMIRDCAANSSFDKTIAALVTKYSVTAVTKNA